MDHKQKSECNYLCLFIQKCTECLYSSHFEVSFDDVITARLILGKSVYLLFCEGINNLVLNSEDIVLSENKPTS